MMKVLKKLLVLVLALTLTVSSLAGCGTKKTVTTDATTAPDATTETEVSTQETAEVTTAEEEVKPSGKIVVWTWDAADKSLALNMEAFQSEYPDIEVEVQIMGNKDLYQKMLLGLSAGGEGLPDVATIETSNLAQYVSLGGLMDLTEKTAPYVDKINSYKWIDATLDEKIYAMPWDSGPVALYYRTDIFEKAGLPSDPEEVTKLLATWEDYYNTAKIIKEKTGSYMLSESQDMFSGRDYEKLLWETGTFYFDEEGNPQLNSPESIQVMTFLTKMVQEGLTDNTAEWTQAWYDGFANGTVATIPGASWVGGFLTSWIAPDAAGLWRVIPLPAWEVGGNTASNDGGSNFVIPDTSENKDAAWAYVEFMLGREDSQLAMYKNADLFPALETTYTDSFFEEEVPYYNGQKARSVFADIVTKIPSLSYTKNYSQASESLIEAYGKIILNGESVEQALQEANEQVMAKSE
jgi:lactose/L-arabinose transport system substrate-binding protein